MPLDTSPVALHETARSRYLSYALSVITSRALPDVRDGLKPVQRRILYAMFHNLHLTPDARYKKCAAIVGEVLGKYHPHGDTAVYDALVRMAQDFSLLHPLVDGQGNFGSIDGDAPAAYRYTEARLRPIAMELLTELKQHTVDTRETYNGEGAEPVVLPAQFPNLLVNGVEGIAVGMATRIPPHNLREIIDACVVLIDDDEATNAQLCRKVRGPDFPTAGEIVTGADELRQVYEDGEGPVRLRGTWEPEQRGRKHLAVVTSVPYGVVKADLVEKIGELVRERKVPQITDVRDESTTDVRVVCELRALEDGPAAMAFLYKHTRLQIQFNVNFTCLVPTENPEVGAPRRLDLKSILRHWLDFRYDTVRKRYEYELKELRDRIHVLEGFALVFDCLDEAIRIIRASEGKRDAADKLMARFGLDDAQVEAILELKLYKLAKLEILVIREELAEKLGEASRIEDLLASRPAMWGVVRQELTDLRRQYGVDRRTALRGDLTEAAYSEDAYVVAEDAVVIVTRDGWIKRQQSITAVDKIRLRDGDALGWVYRADTRSSVTLLSSAGSAYTVRVADVESTTGYGKPVQSYFSLADRETIVGVVSHDPRNLPPGGAPPEAEDPPPPYLVAISRQGKVVRTPIALFVEASTRNGRRYASLEKDGNDEIVAAYPAFPEQFACVASLNGNVLAFQVAEVPVLKGPGRGVMAIKLRDDDRVFAFELASEPDAGPTVLTALGRQEVVTWKRFSGSRAARGHQLFKRGYFAQWKRPLELVVGRPPTEGEA